MDSHIIVFDIETVPDVASGRRLYGLDDISDHDMAEIMLHERRQSTGGEFLRPHLHRIVAISLMMRSPEHCKVWSLGSPQAPEPELVKRFFDGIARHTPTLVSWNGSGFDLPVLHYRALLHGISAPRYWEIGDNEQGFRWNNYIGRFHWRHTDLMDVLAAYQPRAAAPLDEIAIMLGLPGKLGMHGSKVWKQFQIGDIDSIRNYCETDVLNTYLVYLRFELIRGRLTGDQYRQECQMLRDSLLKDAREYGKTHLDQFCSQWQTDEPYAQT